MAESIETTGRNPRVARSRTAVAFQVAGGAALSVAAFGYNTLIGWAVLGVELVVFGVVTEVGG